MSRTYRTYTVSDWQLRSIEREHERNEREMRRQMDQALHNVTLDAERNVERARQEMDRNLNRAIGSLSKDMEELDKKHRQQLQNLSDSVYRDLAKQQKDLLSVIEASSTELHSRIDSVTKVMEKQFRDQQMQIKDVNLRVDSLFDKIAQEESRMEEVVRATADLLKAVAVRTPVSIYTPLQFSRINRRVQDLLSNTDPATSKIALAREISNSIWEMEEDAILAKAKHDAIYNYAISKLSAVLAFVHENRTKDVQPNGVDTYKIETDYWTRGDYAMVENELEEIKTSLSSSSDQLSEDEIKARINAISDLEQRCKVLIEQAVNRSILSERRVEMAEDIVNSLLEQGWQLTTENGKEAFNYMGGEEENDQREAVYAILCGPEGQEITVVVSPDSIETKNTISFHRNDEREMTDNEFLMSLSSIQKEIERCGYQLGESKCSSGHDDDARIPEMASSSKLSKKGAVSRIIEQTK